MSDHDDKRRLQLLPEVLPQPRADEGPGGPRERTLGHLQHLLALAAASTAFSGCSNKDAGAPDASAPVATADSTAATASATASAPPDPTPSATADAIIDAGAPDAATDAAAIGSAAASASAKPKPPARPRSGYHVVDMLPPPSRKPVQ